VVHLPDGEAGALVRDGGNEVTYDSFLKSKRMIRRDRGKEFTTDDVHSKLFAFQRDITLWAVRKGMAAVFADTGLGKTFIQLEWARLLGEKTLIIAPLSVARQTVREARKIDLEIGYVRSQDAVVGDGQLWITNYEMVNAFDVSAFGAVVLDESSILKCISGKTRRKLTEACQAVPYRLCCTATPAPNDFIELGNHAEFLGVCSRAEMLAMFFVNANKEHTMFVNGKSYRRKGSNKGGQEWRLKHHAEEPFFRWLASWAMAIRKPSDLGYDDMDFRLPALRLHKHFEQAKYEPGDRLFFTRARGIREHSAIRRATLGPRLERLQEIIDGDGQQWIVWVGLDEEGRAATEALDGAVEVKGSDSPDYKASSFEDFQDGKFRVLVTKPTIGGFGMNFQNAHKMAFLGLSHSWEQYYQCVRREWRYLQEHPVDVHLIMSDIEADVYRNVMRKDAQARRLREGLIGKMHLYEREELGMGTSVVQDQAGCVVKGNTWKALRGDSCERLAELDNDSVDLCIYSPPFADLYTYSDSPRDLGNSRDWKEFLCHYSFVIREVLRVVKPGRLCCVHTSDIPALAQKDGYIGIKDFPGAVIAAHEAEGWVFHGRILVGKNPQAQAIRTHSKALLFVQLRKDSADSRPALVDHVLLFKKPGENAVPVTPVENGEMDNDLWVQWANGIWTDIQETDTLQYQHAREADDEKHICPLQLPTIRRCVMLYSNPGETILSPFAGIGSEGFESVKAGRGFVGIELKPEYFEVMVGNLQKAEAVANQPDLFSLVNEESAQ